MITFSVARQGDIEEAIKMARKGGMKREADDRTLDLYLREIGETRLITAEEEVDLAKKIKAGDEKALNDLTKANLRFVVSVAKQYQNQGLELADLINEGNVGLIKAAKRFDETRGFKFISYAVWWIRQAILQALAEQSRIVRLPQNRVGTLHKIGKISSLLEQEYGREPSPDEIAAELNIGSTEIADTINASFRHLSLDAPFKESDGNDGDDSILGILPDEFQQAPDEALLSESLRLEIERALDTLSAREAEVISLYFGLNKDKALTLEEIGARFNLTRERVRQIKEKALIKLRDRNRSRRLRAFVC